ncbi:hypothetical protein [uncultured Pseudokineococcus sp.]|uniref:endonuclease domain-containing protein n=1 Tax=uncultured Pseudokineococcus sp. TaxID=1642928 RepID=UPI002616C939|nr:hypothetical protein [uncultured Pseudokineococcus sp.]
MRLRLAPAPKVFRGCDALRWGDLTRAELLGPRFQRVLRGTYAPAAADADHALFCAAAGLLVPGGALLTGASAASVLGLRWLGPRDDVEMVIPEGTQVPRRAGVTVRRSTEPLLGGSPWATTTLAAPTRIAFDAAARAPLPLAVGRLDALVRAGLCSAEALLETVERSSAGDVVGVRRAVGLVDPRSESLPESALRVHLQLSGLPVVPQHRVMLDGREVARVDLALVEEQVAVEYDGQWHALREQLTADRQRLNRLAAARWAVVHVTADDLRHPRRVVALVRAAAAEQRARGRSVSRPRTSAG